MSPREQQSRPAGNEAAGLLNTNTPNATRVAALTVRTPSPTAQQWAELGNLLEHLMFRHGLDLVQTWELVRDEAVPVVAPRVCDRLEKLCRCPGQLGRARRLAVSS